MRVFGIDPGSERTGYGCIDTDGQRHRLVASGANARSALKLGHARGVAMLAAVEAGLAVIEYTPAEVKRAVVGYGRAEKQQVAEMVRVLLHLDVAPAPFDASDALAVAICHVHATGGAVALPADAQRLPRSWRQWRPPAGSRPS